MKCEIEMFAQCRKCMAQRPKNISRADYARTGFLKDGRLQVWCNRHELPVATFTLAGEDNPCR